MKTTKLNVILCFTVILYFLVKDTSKHTFVKLNTHPHLVRMCLK